MASVLAIDQDHDVVTKYGQAFREHLLRKQFATYFPQHALVRLANSQVTRSAIDAEIKVRDIGLITGVGHGLYHCFTGNGATIWDASEDLSYLRGRIVHLLSCQTGGWLGRKMVECGVRAFWGYSVNFVFFHANPPPAVLHLDTVAEQFLRMDVYVVRGILAGKDSDAIAVAIGRYFGAVYSKMKSNAHRAALLDNYLHLVSPSVSWGDRRATL